MVWEMCVRLYHLLDVHALDVLDLVDELHLWHPLVVLEPADWPDHTQQKQQKQQQKLRARAPLLLQ